MEDGRETQSVPAKKTRCTVSALRAVTALVFMYLCAGELLPPPISKAIAGLCWQKRQVISLSALSCVPFLFGRVSRGTKHSQRGDVSGVSVLGTFALMNVAPIAAAVATGHWARASDNCPIGPRKECKYLSVLLDAIGLVTARLARMDLGICILLASRGQSTWVFEMTGGLVGFTEALPLHRTAGWWCVGQSALHSVAYLLFYLHESGMRAVSKYCFPTHLATGFNRLGLVNMFGLLGFLAGLTLALAALPQVRRYHYHIFQQLHLPVSALFVLCCALHDLPILLFAAPGLADWYLGWRDETKGRRLPARAKVLQGTSGPWIELIVDCDEVVTKAARSSQIPRGQWVAISLAPLGRESHPLSVASVSTSPGHTEISMLVSAKAGDWTRALATLVSKDHPYPASFEAVVSGPYPFGGGEWSLLGAGLRHAPRGLENGCSGFQESALLLLAGGTGIAGWLPTLKAAVAVGSSGQPCHLVWCVQTEADYLALARQLPRYPGMGKSRNAYNLTIFITRPGASNTSERNQASTNSEEPIMGMMTTRTKVLEGEDECCVQGNADDLFTRKIGTPPVVSLVVAIVGLVVQHYIWWGWLVHLLGSSKTTTRFAVMHRALPVALILGCMMVATTVGSRFVQAARYLHHRSWFRYSATRRMPCARIVDFFGANRDDYDVVDAESGAIGEDIPLQAINLQSDEPLNALGRSEEYSLHDVRVGRPDIHELVYDTAIGLCAREGTRVQLVVAACGPMKMVEETRKGVEAARKVPNLEHVHLQFYSTESRW